MTLHFGSKDKHEGEKEYKTIFGGFVSISLRILYIFCCIVFLMRMISNEEARIYIYESDVNWDEFAEEQKTTNEKSFYEREVSKDKFLVAFQIFKEE